MCSISRKLPGVLNRTACQITTKVPKCSIGSISVLWAPGQLNGLQYPAKLVDSNKSYLDQEVMCMIKDLTQQNIWDKAILGGLILA